MSAGSASASAVAKSMGNGDPWSALLRTELVSSANPAQISRMREVPSGGEGTVPRECMTNVLARAGVLRSTKDVGRYGRDAAESAEGILGGQLVGAMTSLRRNPSPVE